MICPSLERIEGRLKLVGRDMEVVHFVTCRCKCSVEGRPVGVEDGVFRRILRNVRDLVARRQNRDCRSPEDLHLTPMSDL
jgi:hypothetical protein